MTADTKDHPAPLALSDAAVANLEDHLPGGNAVADDGGQSLQNRITATLSQLEQRLSHQSRAMMPGDEFRKMVAARQAVQAAKLAMQLHQAGHQGKAD